MLFDSSPYSKDFFDYVYKKGLNWYKSPRITALSKHSMTEKIRALAGLGVLEGKQEIVQKADVLYYGIYGKHLDEGDPLNLSSILNGYDIWWIHSSWRYYRKLEEPGFRQYCEEYAQQHGLLINRLCLQIQANVMAYFGFKKSSFSRIERYMAVQTLHQIYQQFLSKSSIHEARRDCVSGYARRISVETHFLEKQISKACFFKTLPARHKFDLDKPWSDVEFLSRDFFEAALAYSHRLKDAAFVEEVQSLYGQVGYLWLLKTVDKFLNKTLTQDQELGSALIQMIPTVHYLYRVALRIIERSNAAAGMADVIDQNRRLLSIVPEDISKPCWAFWEQKQLLQKGLKWKNPTVDAEASELGASAWIHKAIKATSVANVKNIFNRSAVLKALRVSLPLILYHKSPLHEKKLSRRVIQTYVSDLRRQFEILFNRLKLLRKNGGLYTLSLYKKTERDSDCSGDETEAEVKCLSIGIKLSPLIETPIYNAKKKCLALPASYTPVEKKAAVEDWAYQQDLGISGEHDIITAKLEIDSGKLSDIIEFTNQIWAFCVNGLLFAQNKTRRMHFLDNCYRLAEALFEDQNYAAFHSFSNPLFINTATTRIDDHKAYLARQELKSESFNQLKEFFAINHIKFKQAFEKSGAGIPYIGYLTNQFDRNAVRAQDMINVEAAFQADHLIFGSLSARNLHHKTQSSSFLQEIESKGTLYSEEQLAELSYAIRPLRVSLGAERPDFTNLLQLPADAESFLPSIVHDLNKKAASLFFEIPSDAKMRSVPSSFDQIERCYNDLCLYFTHVLETSLETHLYYYCLRNFIQLGCELLNSGNLFALASVMTILRDSIPKIFQEEELKSLYEKLERKYIKAFTRYDGDVKKAQPVIPPLFLALTKSQKPPHKRCVDLKKHDVFLKDFESFQTTFPEKINGLLETSFQSDLFHEIEKLVSCKAAECRRTHNPFYFPSVSSSRIVRLKSIAVTKVHSAPQLMKSYPGLSQSSVDQKSRE